MQLKNEINECIEKFQDGNWNKEKLDLFKSNYTISDDEIKIVELYVFEMEFLYSKAMELSSQKTCSLSYLIPFIKQIMNHFTIPNDNLNKEEENDLNLSTIMVMDMDFTFLNFDDAESSNIEITKDNTHLTQNEYCLNKIKRELYNKILEKVNHYFTEKNNIFENENCLLATFLNPVFKHRVLKEDWKKKCDEYLFTYFPNRIQKPRDLFDSIISEEEEEEQEVFDEINEYKRMKRLDGKSTFTDIMNFWERHKSSLPTLYKLAMRFLTYLASSCPSERLFSDASLYYTETRTRTLTETLKRQCRVHSYYLSEDIC